MIALTDTLPLFVCVCVGGGICVFACVHAYTRLLFEWDGVAWLIVGVRAVIWLNHDSTTPQYLIQP